MPSPFIDIMMLRQASRTSQTCRCGAGIDDLDDGVREAVVGHALIEAPEVAEERAAVLAGELDEQQAVRRAPA